MQDPSQYNWCKKCHVFVGHDLRIDCKCGDVRIKYKINKKFFEQKTSFFLKK